MKRCSKCKEEKEFSEFWVNRKAKSGYNFSCKQCEQVTREKNKEIKKRLKWEKFKTEVQKEYSEILNSDSPEEVWKDIPKFNGEYQASSLGRIRQMPIVYKHKNIYKRTKYRILKAFLTHVGYYTITLTNKETGYKVSRGVHRWVMFAFHGEREESIQVNHINGVKDDNRLENLEYMTGVENMHYRKVTNPEDYHCKYRGVFKCRNKGNIQDRVVSCIKVEGVNYYLGSWIDTPENQKIASDTYEKAYDNWYNKGIYPKNVGRQNKTAKALGVGFHKLSGRYRVRYKGEYIGIFDTEELAERIYFLVEYLVESRKVELNKELISKIKKKYTTDRRLAR